MSNSVLATLRVVRSRVACVSAYLTGWLAAGAGTSNSSVGGGGGRGLQRREGRPRYQQQEKGDARSVRVPDKHRRLCDSKSCRTD